jgi:hypothetical protein
MLLNILFLDIDGVLNPDKDNHPHVFAPECVAQLQRILDAVPTSHVVFTTTCPASRSADCAGASSARTPANRSDNKWR